MNIVTLTTDFGATDWFVGSMKGVILTTNPRVTVVDITHEIPSGDIRAGAFTLLASYRCFIRNTVHLVVVDPGVGGSRAPIAVRTEDYSFVGPDNGVLSLALAKEKVVEVRRLDNDVYFRKPVSATFHGRDIFAPVAARLTEGILMDSLGEKLKDYVRLQWPGPKVAGGALHGEIVYVDHFGNAITNIEAREVSGPVKRAVKVTGREETECELKRSYQEVPVGEPLAIIGSTGLVEIAVNGGHAARALGLKIGDRVEVR